jgi:enoyl-CoA hydratase
MAEGSTVLYDTDGPVAVITIDRPAARNAVNHATAQALAAAFRRFDTDPSSSVAILTGRGGAFCAGFDLKETAAGRRGHRVESGDAPMGPTRLKLSKPVIAAIEGPAVAGARALVRPQGGGARCHIRCLLSPLRRSIDGSWHDPAAAADRP